MMITCSFGENSTVDYNRKLAISKVSQQLSSLVIACPTRESLGVIPISPEDLGQCFQMRNVHCKYNRGLAGG